jgi:PKD repeat protein
MQFRVTKQTLSTSILLSDIELQGPNPNNATIGTPNPIITPASDSATTTVSLVIVGPPTADAGADQTVPVGTQVFLNASKSISTGTGTTYTWTFTDVNQQTLTGMIANYTFNNPGTYNITLTVRDSLGSDNSYVTVTVLGATTITATTSSGASINLTISGNITSSQMSSVMIATSQSANTTTISFTVAGQNGTTGFGNITVPKSAVTCGITPTTFIDGQAAQEQGYSENSNNYYVWYMTHFSSHSISIVFSTVSLTLSTPTTTNPTVQSFNLPPTILGILVILTILVLGGSFLWLRKRTNNI